MTFSDLGLSEKVLKAVEQAGYTQPTPIQEGAIPVVLQRRDVLGIAQTGTGKTAGFTLPMLTLLEKGRARARMPRSLILEPTRELAAQVQQSFEIYGAEHKLTVALLIGGVSFADQDRKLDRGADVLIATPGRLLDHFERGKLMLNGVETLVVDEADRMLDMGFIPDIERIFKLCPATRQTLFFSATMPPEIQRLTNMFLHDPVRVEVAPPATAADTIDQRFVAVSKDPKEKRAALRNIIRENDVQNAIIFCNRKRDVGIVAKSLIKHGFNAGALHGDMDQYKRIETLDAFRDGSLALLVASDVAARGLDIPDVGHVLNFDVPVVADDYVHRIGRTGRAGRKGNAITLVTPACRRAVEGIDRLIEGDLVWLGATPKPAEQDKPARGRNAKRRSESRSGGHSKREAPKTRAKPADKKRKPEARREPAKPEKAARDRVKGMGDHVPAFLKRPVRN
jgi:superfamily II DNA/RNA helicase